MDHDRLMRVLEGLPEALVRRVQLDEVLAELGEDIAVTLGMTGAGVMLEDDEGQLRFIGASDPTLQELERLQVAHDEGPCLLAYRTGDEVVAADLREDDRFPRFARDAFEAGMVSVVSLPLVHEDEVIGALNLYHTEPVEVSDAALRVGRTLAQVATAYLLHARDASHFRDENQHLVRALQVRVVVEQAKGWLRATLDLDEEGAWSLLRGHARDPQRPVRDVAEELLDGRLAAEELRSRTS